MAVMLCQMAPVPVMAASNGYKFTYKGVTVSMHKKAKKLIKKAGTPVSKKSSKSCAYDGYDRTYKYEDFILYTYSKSDKGAEFINGITFLTDKVSTKEGIKIGSSYDDVVEAYGRGSSNYGVYTFKKGKCSLQMEIKDGKVANIRYVGTE